LEKNIMGNDPSCFHNHKPKNYNKAFFIATFLNGIFVVFQIIFSMIANSTSLLADGFHNLGDVLGLLLAWVANGLLKRLPSARMTYGMKKTTILATLGNGVLLVFSCGIIVTEAIYKFFYPVSINTRMVMVVAGIGMLINGLTASLFYKEKKDLNIKAAYLHLFYDALISLGVLFSGAIIYFSKWLWVDPIVSLFIAAIIMKGTWSLFKNSFRLILDGVPYDISWPSVHKDLEAIPGVNQVHDLHIWALSTQENALSVHLWMPEKILTDSEREELSKKLLEKYNISHITIQIERDVSHCTDTCYKHIF
jgi:cobalt-zinc-cadmium efflux system protein